MPDITNQTLAEFFETAKQEKDFSYDFKISDEVKFVDYFAGFANKTNAEKNHLVIIAEKSIKDISEERKKEIFDLARTNKEAFAHWYKYSGNNSGYCFKVVGKSAENNNFSDNLYLIDDVVNFDEQGFMNGKKEEIITLPKDKANIIARLFANAKSYDEKRKNNNETSLQEAYSAIIIQKILKRGDLLNYEPKNVNTAGITSQEIREMINNTVNKENIVNINKKFIFDGKNANKKLLGFALAAQLTKDEFVQSDGEQKSPNPEKMREYLEMRNLILDASESVVGKYITDGHGEERTNAQKFKALVAEINASFDKKDYKVLQDYLLAAIHRDINAGNAAKLEDDELRLITEHDKDAYWLNKINDQSPETAKKIIQTMSKSFSARQSRVADLIAPEITLNYGTNKYRTGNILDTKVSINDQEYKDGVANSKVISTKEKEEFLEKASVFVEENLLKQAKEEKDFADEYHNDVEEQNRLFCMSMSKDLLVKGLSSLQDLYAEIQEKLSDKPNEAEKYLSKENMEKLLQDFPICRGLDLPEQGKLPILFGRKKEEARRKELEERIEKFNEKLQIFQTQTKIRRKYSDLSAYKGKLLENSTIESLKTELEKIDLTHKEKSMNMKAKYSGKGFNGRMYNEIDAKDANANFLNTQQKSQVIKTEIKRVEERKQQLAETAKDVLAPENSPLQIVTKDMDKDTKTAIRQANKEIIDPLAKSVNERIKAVRNK